MKKRRLKMHSFIKKNTWLDMPSIGWGNGYVVLPAGHPYHGVGYDNIPVEVHVGLTFAMDAEQIEEWEEYTPEMAGGWVVGFDTAHAYDNAENCSINYVRSEKASLKKQLQELNIKT
jgi:hypothetical protein